jgi:hypothetical protein
MHYAKRVASLPVREIPPTRDSQYTAVVHAADGVRFTATARRPDELARRVVEYISERCDDTLWPAEACRVHELMHDGSLYAAIALYFSIIGGRWDVERLELGGLSNEHFLQESSCRHLALL